MALKTYFKNNLLFKETLFTKFRHIIAQYQFHHQLTSPTSASTLYPYPTSNLIFYLEGTLQSFGGCSLDFMFPVLLDRWLFHSPHHQYSWSPSPSLPIASLSHHLPLKPHWFFFLLCFHLFPKLWGQRWSRHPPLLHYVSSSSNSVQHR